MYSFKRFLFANRRIAGLLVLVLFTCLLGASYLRDIGDVEFHPDESQWIGASKFYEEFLSFNYESELFEPSHWSLTQPPVAYYVIGIARQIGGFGWKELNEPWSWGLTVEENIQRGSMPSDELLWWSRLPMAISAVVTIITGFFLLRKALNILTGVIWILLLLNNSFFLLHLRRAMAEASFLFFTMLATLCCYQFLRIASSGETSSRR